MKKTALVILAAGLGSRYGNGIKQLEPVGPKGEFIMDYSIYDALAAGFTKIVFIIRRDLEKEFRQGIGRRIEKIAQVEYAFQELEDLPQGFTCPKERTKPWGTVQALLACRNILSEPFAVINADDYYGKEAFRRVHDFLVKLPDGERHSVCMAGFVLANTLSDNGVVTRGICTVDAAGKLIRVTETRNILKTNGGAGIVKDGGQIEPLDVDSLVSMNMWGLTPAFLQYLGEGFACFLKELPEGDCKSEYLLPTAVDELLQADEIQVEVLSSRDTWFGVTYKEDKKVVQEALEKLTKQGEYPLGLYDA